MIRTTLLMLLVAFLAGYAWRNWFVSLCGAVLLMAVVQHPDFPNSIGGIQGANPWNLLLLMVVLAWACKRKSEGLIWDMPPLISCLLIGYLIVVLVGVIRLLGEPPISPDYTFMTIISEDLINCIKWVIPGLLLYDACRTRRRVAITIAVVMALYFLLAVQVVKCMPLSSAISGNDLSARASKVTQSNMGYNRVTLSMMLAGASWAMLCCLPLLKKNYAIVLVVAAAAVIALGQALTGGRTGYVAWGTVGMILAFVRWRRLLLVIPVVAMAIAVLLPGVRERMLQGIGGNSGSIVVETDQYEMTSGRNIAWPKVIEKIGENPIVGYGRKAMSTTGIKRNLMEDHGENFGHPHQAYFQVILDNGLIGFAVIIPFYLIVLWRGFRLLSDRIDPLNAVAGGVVVSLVLALMIGAMGGQTFYPREGSVGMWVAIGVALRMSVDRNRALESGLLPSHPVPQTDLMRAGIA
jgi:O-antigen ligase